MKALGPIVPWVSQILREPLVQFFALGAAAFALHGAVASPTPDVNERRLHLGQDAIAATVAAFEAERGRGPTADELRALIDERIERAALFDEASRLGLDRGDPIVRRRMVQKMRFVLEGQAKVANPTPADLREFRDAHPERFRVGDRVHFVHVFVDARQHDDPPARASIHLAALQTGGAARGRGDPFLHGSRFAGQTKAAITRSFGADFATALMTVRADAWTIVPSAYGWHVVKVTQRAPGHLRPVDQIAAQLEQQWLASRQRDAIAGGLRTLRERYVVTIDDVALADAHRVAAQTESAQ